MKDKGRHRYGEIDKLSRTLERAECSLYPDGNMAFYLKDRQNGDGDR